MKRQKLQSGKIMNLQYSQGRETDLKLGIIKMNNESSVVDADKY
jgi:hypothetical protein